MKPIDRVTKHFSTLTPNVFDVPQWADESGAPLVVLVNPLTVKDRDRLQKLEERIGPGLELAVMGIIWFALDEDGNHLFTLADKPALMIQSDPSVVLSVAAEVLGEVDADAIKKKSDPTEVSASA